MNEIKSLLETLFCYKREMVERPDDDKELVRLNQIGNAYGMLMAYVSSDRKKQLHREIEKKALEKVKKIVILWLNRLCCKMIPFPYR